MNYSRFGAGLAPFAAIAVIGLAGCAAPTGYEKAFSQGTALSGNSHNFAAPADVAFRTVKITLVQQGFTIEQADAAGGLIKAVRALQDPAQPKFAYLITTTVDVSGMPSGDATMITVSASQQTVLHKDSNKYYKLLGLVPIPTGKVYQTVVTKEGNIVTTEFYHDFFAAVAKNLKQIEVVTTPLRDSRAAPPALARLADDVTGRPRAATETRQSAAPDTPAVETTPPARAAEVGAKPAAAPERSTLLTMPNPFAAPAPGATEAQR